MKLLAYIVSCFLLLKAITSNIIGGDDVIHDLVHCSKVTIQNVCPNSNVTFWLYTNNECAPHQLLEIDPDSMSKAPFAANSPIIILLHGWTGSKDGSPNSQVRPNYLKEGYNVISVDYKKVAPSPCYREAVSNSDTVAQCVAEMVKLLVDNEFVNTKKITIDDFHLIGFSLGGQIAGRAGTYLKKHGFTIPRITGLDVAAPLFYGPSSYLSKASAKFVDAIHTNAGEFGKLLPVGHVDFYVNGFFKQKGCSPLNISCNHSRAPELYAESISNKLGFCGTSMFGGVEVMGESVSYRARGVYHVKTNSQPPYARGCPKNDL